LIFRNRQETAEAETALIYVTAQALILYAVFLGRFYLLTLFRTKTRKSTVFSFLRLFKEIIYASVATAIWLHA